MPVALIKVPTRPASAASKNTLKRPPARRTGDRQLQRKRTCDVSRENSRREASGHNRQATPACVAHRRQIGTAVGLALYKYRARRWLRRTTQLPHVTAESFGGSNGSSKVSDDKRTNALSGVSSPESHAPSGPTKRTQACAPS